MESGFRRRLIGPVRWKTRSVGTGQWRCAMNASVRRRAPLAHWRVSRRTIAVIGALAPLAACEWFTDFKRQPKIDPWERLDSAGVRGNPQTSVPITGSVVPGFVVSYANLPATIDSM